VKYLLCVNSYADTGLGNRDRMCDVLGEVITAVLRHYSRQKLEDLFMK